jgi:hypothetical protein
MNVRGVGLANGLIILGIALFVWFLTAFGLIMLNGGSNSDPFSYLVFWVATLIPTVAVAMIAAGILLRKANYK